VTRDPDQTDLPHKGYNPLERLFGNIKRKRIEERGNTACYEFPREAIVRDEIVVEMLDAFDDGLDDDAWPAPEHNRRPAATPVPADEDVPSYGKKVDGRRGKK
jgi:hypothetical protein